MITLNQTRKVLMEQKFIGKWLAENLGKDMATVFRWCNNCTQLSIKILAQVASLLDINIQNILLESK